MIKSRTGRRLQNRGRYWSKLKVKLANSPTKCSTIKRSWQILIEKTGRSCSLEPHQTKTENKSSKTMETTACEQPRSVVSTICAEWKRGLGELSTRSAGRLTNSCILVNWWAAVASEGLVCSPWKSGDREMDIGNERTTGTSAGNTRWSTAH